MLCLLDTHLILWAAYSPEKLPKQARDTISDQSNTLLFSAASIWEVAIKSGVGRSDFTVDSGVLRRGLAENGYEELAITSRHAAAVSGLPKIHRDPFDRILVAQARMEGIALFTSDATVAAYGSPAQLVL